MKKLTCIICPNGCVLDVESTDGGIKVSGNLCPKGEAYAREEIISPKRTISSSIRVIGGDSEIVSVRLDRAVPKDMIFPVMDAIRGAHASAPVHIGDVLIHDVAGTGADVIAIEDIS